MAKRLDIVIFGITGFTGLRTIPYITKIIKDYNCSLTWGVAGRSEAKIKRMLKEYGLKNGISYDNVRIIIADVNDDESLKKMTSQARIIINACGPYHLYGEQVVKACLATGTHHVDISPELVFMEKMQLLYHEEAKSKGIYIVNACGLDCIPTDIGINFLKNNFEGTLNSVETYAYTIIEDLHLGGPTVNVGTFSTILYIIANYKKFYSQRKSLFKSKLPPTQPIVKRKLIHKGDLVNRWCIPFFEQPQVSERSQHFFYDLYKERPIQINCYAALASFFYLMLTCFYGFWVILLSHFSLTRAVMIKYPRIFTHGLCSTEGPSDARQETTTFCLILQGKGWSKKIKDPFLQPDSPPNKEIVAKVTGNNPAYGLTCAAFAVSAIMILTEADKMPDKGGVYPPGVAFAKTSIIEKLQENGVKFELLYKS